MRENDLDALLTDLRDVALDPNEQTDAERRLTARWQNRETRETAPGPTTKLRRARLPLLVAATTLTLAGGALAADALLRSGDPVPVSTAKRFSYGTIRPETSRIVDVGTRDPEGGPGWAMLLYGLRVPGAPKPDGTRFPSQELSCAAPARPHDGKVGVVGRDGMFANDGRFHELIPESRPSGGCGSVRDDGAVYFDSYGPTIPASGYTGPIPSTAGGCKEAVADPRTQSKQTIRRLKNVPVCAPSGQRIVKYGFAGPRASHITFGNDRFRQEHTPKPGQSGAYMFVVLPRQAGSRPPVLTVTYDNGLICKSSIAGRDTRRACLSPPGLEPEGAS